MSGLFFVTSTDSLTIKLFPIMLIVLPFIIFCYAGVSGVTIILLLVPIILSLVLIVPADDETCNQPKCAQQNQIHSLYYFVQLYCISSLSVRSPQSADSAM